MPKEICWKKAVKNVYLQPTMITNDTIVALATAQGMGAIGVIRLSGKQALSICHQVFKGKNLEAQPSHTIQDRKSVV